MKLRTFLARDMREALANVRAELGNEAVIVGSEKAKGGGVMVRAAVEEAAPPEGIQEALAVFSQWHSAMAGTSDFESTYRAGLIHRLRNDRTTEKTPPRNFSRAELLQILRTHRAPDSLAHELAEACEKTNLSDMTLALASALDSRMKTAPLDIAQAKALLLTGPQGAGKSAVAAKIAAHARLSGREVKLIATDVSGAGAVARLQTFAEHIGVAVIVAETAEELAKAVAECAKENILAVIDTAGFDPRNAKSRSAFAALAKIEHVEAIGVVSACGDAEEIADIAASLVSLGAKRIIVTGLDISRRLGALAAAATQSAALAHITRSPYVAGGLETLTPLSLARALIDAAHADRGSAQ
jgi:flagellar biosynthesis protein FlhF